MNVCQNNLYTYQISTKCLSNFHTYQKTTECLSNLHTYQIFVCLLNLQTYQLSTECLSNHHTYLISTQPPSLHTHIPKYKQNVYQTSIHTKYKQSVCQIRQLETDS